MRGCARPARPSRTSRVARPRQRIGNRPDLKALIQAHVKGNLALDKAAFKDHKDVKIENKELKNEKAEVKERKEKVEVKEFKQEAKEFKNEKIEVKERKEKIEVIEGKQVIIDGGGKNFVLEGGGGKHLVEGGGGDGGVVINPPSAGGGLEARLAAVEQSVAALSHFIGADLRPDLGSGALAREADLSGGADASKSAKDAKDAKEMKDSELGGSELRVRGALRPGGRTPPCGRPAAPGPRGAAAVVTTEELVYARASGTEHPRRSDDLGYALAGRTASLGPGLRGTLNRVVRIPSAHSADRTRPTASTPPGAVRAPRSACSTRCPASSRAAGPAWALRRLVAAGGVDGRRRASRPGGAGYRSGGADGPPPAARTVLVVAGAVVAPGRRRRCRATSWRDAGRWRRGTAAACSASTSCRPRRLGVRGARRRGRTCGPAATAVRRRAARPGRARAGGRVILRRRHPVGAAARGGAWTR